MALQPSPIVRKIYGFREPENLTPDQRYQPSPTEPIVLTIECGTSQGPYRLRITQVAAQELAAALNMHPLTRGSA
jgi:hypothetical protein